MPYRKAARARYRFFSTMLTVISPVKPLFRLALRVLTHKKLQMKGHILPLNTPLGRPEQSPLGREVLEELIERSTVVGAMNECLCRTVGGCTDYPADLGCLVLGDAVKSLHPGLGHEVLREDAMAIVDRALALNLVPMVIHLKSDALLWSLEHQRMLTICFCCPCHCLIREAMARQKSASLVTGLPGVSVQFDADKCVSCAQCASACFAGALEMKGGQPNIDGDRCVACGRCAMACVSGALSVNMQENVGAGPLLRVYKQQTKQNSVFRQ